MGNDGTMFSWILVGFLLAVSITLMIAFMRREARVSDPIIDLKILKERPFVAANIYNFVYGTCYICISAFIPLYAVSVYGMSILESGFILTPKSVGALLASAVTSISLVRWGYRWRC